MAVIWHYLENQFDNITKNNRKLCNAIFQDHHAKLANGALTDVRLQPLLALLNPVKGVWDDIYGQWKNSQAAYRSSTQAVDNLFEVLRVKPVGGGRSRIDEWDSKVKSFWSAGNPVYDYLFPRGREPFTTGSVEEMAGEVDRLAERLQTKAAALTLLAAAPGNTPEQTAEFTEQADALGKLKIKVAAFSKELSDARVLQTANEGVVDQLSPQVEAARLEVSDAIYRNLAGLMGIFYQASQRLQVTGFFDLTLIMNPPAADDATPDAAVPVAPPVV